MLNSSILSLLLFFLSAMMLQYFVVIKEDFQAERRVSYNPLTRIKQWREDRRAKQQAAAAAAAPPPPAPTPAPQPPTPTPTPPPATPSASCPPCPACQPQAATPAPAAAPARQATPPPAPVAPPPPTQAGDMLRVDQQSAPARAPPSGMKFSELVNTLTAYPAIKDAQARPTADASKKGLDGSSLRDKSTSAGDLVNDMQQIKTGVKDIQNILLTERTSEPVVPGLKKPVMSDGLQQGQWFRNTPDGACPYAMGQQSDIRFAPVDMNEYIRKDAIPCWGCTLK